MTDNLVNMFSELTDGEHDLLIEIIKKAQPDFNVGKLPFMSREVVYRAVLVSTMDETRIYKSLLKKIEARTCKVIPDGGKFMTVCYCGKRTVRTLYSRNITSAKRKGEEWVTFGSWISSGDMSIPKDVRPSGRRITDQGHVMAFDYGEEEQG